MYLPLYHKHLFPYIPGEEYIKSLIANPELWDRLALSSDDKVNTIFCYVRIEIKAISNLPNVRLYVEFVSVALVNAPTLSMCPNSIGHRSLSFLLPLISFAFLPQNEVGSSKVLFPEHLPLSRIQAGIKSGAFLQGTFRASRDNYLEATVFVQGEGEDSTEVCVCVDLSVNVERCGVWTIIQNLEM